VVDWQKASQSTTLSYGGPDRKGPLPHEACRLARLNAPGLVCHSPRQGVVWHGPIWLGVERLDPARSGQARQDKAEEKKALHLGGLLTQYPGSSLSAWVFAVPDARMTRSDTSSEPTVDGDGHFPI
jgi:hypothetical protein